MRLGSPATHEWRFGQRSAASAGRLLADRAAWRERIGPPGCSRIRATMARTFAYLFGIGATLFLVTLPLPHAADRDIAGLVATAVAPMWRRARSRSCSTAFRSGRSRSLPSWARSWSASGSTSVAPRPPPPTPSTTSGSRWPPATSSPPPIAAAHLILASAAYGVTLLLRPDIPVPALKWSLATGTLLATAS